MKSHSTLLFSRLFFWPTSQELMALFLFLWRIMSSCSLCIFMQHCRAENWANEPPGISSLSVFGFPVKKTKQNRFLFPSQSSPRGRWSPSQSRHLTLGRHNSHPVDPMIQASQRSQGHVIKRRSQRQKVAQLQMTPAQLLTTSTSPVSPEARHLHEGEPYNGVCVIHWAGVRISFTHPTKQGHHHH